MAHSDDNIFAKTRAEDYGSDIWGEFYIPQYFTKLSLKNATKSTYIVGQRGCGKTMLLKYLDYHTAFSKKRDEIPIDEISHVGIYWRADTQFCNSLHHRGVEEEEWIQVFSSYFSLVIAVEVIKSLRHISRSSYAAFDASECDAIRLQCVKDFGSQYPASLDELERHLESVRRSFSAWISNLNLVERPVLPPGRLFLDSIIEELRAHPKLPDLAYYVYLDEVENLVPYQRHVLNDYLKHGQRPLIVSFTSKEFSDDTRTTGPESINATHDFRLISLDDLSSDDERKVFFAEVFLANIDLDRGDKTMLLDRLRSMDLLSERQSNDYKANVMERICRHFPSKTLKQFSLESLQKPRIREIIKKRINKSLREFSDLSYDEFAAVETNNVGLLIVPALLNRSANNPNALLAEYEKYCLGKTSKFENWVHNNLFGALLEVYRPYREICPLYSGFDTLFTISNNNLRHFLILCYKVFEFAELTDSDHHQIPPEVQARAAYDASEKLIREIKTFGPLGEQLRTFVLRLGNIFRGLQSLPAMSEPEQNQFTINSGGSLNELEKRFLAEAKKHGILSEQLGNKTKSMIGRDIVDFLLNPIYAPYFQISYRRKRKLEMSVNDFNILSIGTEDEYKELYSKLVKDSDGLQSKLW